MPPISQLRITGVHDSPLFGLDVRPEREEKKPKILSVEEIRTLLQKAAEQDHDWYHVWVAAVYDRLLQR